MVYGVWSMELRAAIAMSTIESVPKKTHTEQPTTILQRALAIYANPLVSCSSGGLIDRYTDINASFDIKSRKQPFFLAIFLSHITWRISEILYLNISHQVFIGEI